MEATDSQCIEALTDAEMRLVADMETTNTQCIETVSDTELCLAADEIEESLRASKRSRDQDSSERPTCTKYLRNSCRK